jgi:hypothetical protein
VGVRAARFYGKNTGVYFNQVPSSPSHWASASEPLNSPNPQNKSESKRPLRTKNHQLARKLSSWLNALSDGVPRPQREGHP